jgi:sigma-E factor negative regulatory protein RseA
MKTRLSGLLDGELERQDEPALFEALKRGDELCGRWREYLLISDTLKGEKMLDADITARVMTSLRDEAAVLAPYASMRHTWQRSALALAATVAGVAVVGWVALVPQNNQVSIPAQTLVQRESAAIKPVRHARDMQEYLAAHQAQSSSLQLRGGAENIRTVSTTGIATAK